MNIAVGAKQLGSVRACRAPITRSDVEDASKLWVGSERDPAVAHDRKVPDDSCVNMRDTEKVEMPSNASR